jgi:hypothetical protein
LEIERKRGGYHAHTKWCFVTYAFGWERTGRRRSRRRETEETDQKMCKIILGDADQEYCEK